MIATLLDKFRSTTFAERTLLVLFAVTVPLANPWVRGDGVGYYAYARSLLIQHNLDFVPDYQHANTSFREGRLDESGEPKADLRTPTGHLENHFTIGPAILWSPFLILAHVAVLVARAIGSNVSADGFSAPYRSAMAFGTALYGFLGLFLAFRIAKRFVEERWALLAAVAIWWGSSVPVYMYFNPSWSHAHSAFAVALFLWYWLKTTDGRTTGQWILLGAIAGLMLNVYYANVMILTIVAIEAVLVFREAIRAGRTSVIPGFLGAYILFGITLLICFLPTLISKQVVYGSPLETGYIPINLWSWKSPYLLQVLFSSNHGLFLWTPLLLLSVIGIFLFWRKIPRIGGPVLFAALAFYYFIAAYPDWAGISSFGNRFFVSLTAFFVIGLAVLLEKVASFVSSRKAVTIGASMILACFAFWNIGLMFQWGAHLIPARGAVSWAEVANNQFHVVPVQIVGQLRHYLFRRKEMMQNIEQRDVQQLKEQATP